MRVLLLSTLKRRIGPDIFASRSRIIYELAEGLAKREHSVSLLGTGDSYIPGVEVIPVIEKGWVDLPSPENEFIRDVASLQKMGEMLISLQDKFDLVHNHAYPDPFASVYEGKLQIPLVTTLHALYSDYLDELLSFYPKTNFIALSQGYKKLYKKAKIYSVVYNGVNTKAYKYQGKKKDYLFWLGRLARGRGADRKFLDQKGVRWAIELAESSGTQLYLAGPCEDPLFFEEEVKPHISEKIQWVGDISSEQSLPVEKIISLMQGAKAFLMTVNQDEPFGLVMAEAMACGTPVIAFNRGAVSEIVIDGKTGFVVDPQEGVEGLKKALEKIDNIERNACRKHIEENFTVDKMVDNYEKLYKQLI